MKLGFIGSGNLAQSIIEGLLQKKILKASNIIVSNRSAKKLERFCKKTKIKKAKNNLEVVKFSDVIFLATKPQDLAAVLNEISIFTNQKQIIASLAAGVSSKNIKEYFPKNPVVRVMANLPAKIQKGVFGIYFQNTNRKNKNKIIKIFDSLGRVIIVKSDQQINFITAGSASGVGFIFEFMRIFESWFLKKGFSLQQSSDLAIETFLGAALMAQKFSPQSLTQLRQAVTSKKGTTLAGLKSMSQSKLSLKIAKALDASQRRARQLSQNKLK